MKTLTRLMTRTAPLTLMGLAILSSCTSTRQPVTLQDAQGNYVTTSDYEAMRRAEFEDSMKAGLRDFDERLEKLRARANEVGGDSLADFAECETELMEARRSFENQVLVAEGALNANWPKERSNTIEAYVSLREELQDAYEDVLDV